MADEENDAKRMETMLIGVRDRKDMTDQQRSVYDKIASGPRGDVPFPFLAMLDAPELVDVVQAVGSAIRYASEMSPQLREVAILATAAAFGSQYEWDYHVAIARNIGLTEHTIAAASSGASDTKTDPLFTATIALCRAAVLDRRIDKAALVKITETAGRRVATEIVLIAGYYPVLALFLSAAELDNPHRYSPPQIEG